ncbi:Divalent metal cation transporter MntH [compost metagenome]
MQLPFAVVPLVRFVSDKAKMGTLVAPRWLIVLSWLIGGLIIVLNVKLLVDVWRG